MSKIRSSFVTNSSSSSFIVAIEKDKLPKTVWDMGKLLFGEDYYYPNPYYDPKYGSPTASWPGQEVAQIVFEDLAKKPLTKKQFVEILLSGHCDWMERSWDIKGIWDMSHEEREKILDGIHEQNKKKAEEIAEQWFSQRKDCKFFTFEYSDNDGELHSAMEHGTMFDRLFHIRISKH